MALSIVQVGHGCLKDVRTPAEAGVLGELDNGMERLREAGVPVRGPQLPAHVEQPRDDGGRWM